MAITFNGKIFDENVTIEKVFDVIKEKIDSNAKLIFQNTWNSYDKAFYRSSLVNLTFMNQERCLSLYDYIHGNAPRENKNEQYIWLSLDSKGNAETIITSIIEEFGGETYDERTNNHNIITKIA